MGAAPAVPPGFVPHPIAGEFVHLTGPLYLLREGTQVLLGFRVEPRHANIMGVCHGGMIATFCDMLLPISVHQKSAEVGLRFLPTVSLQVDFLAPAPLGAWVQGEAQILRTTRTLVFAHAVVTADDVPVARASAIMKIGPPMPAIGAPVA